jgi:hypothetical protein
MMHAKEKMRKLAYHYKKKWTKNNAKQRCYNWRKREEKKHKLVTNEI